ncbi:MAG: hypothetical protein JWM35_335 [Verrucomicrobia bacterium]|nr:hypothetical protein [Verrucomicrobiota bacterium]
MRAKSTWMLLVVAVGVALGYWWSHRRQELKTNLAATPRQNVAIQDQKTIDFSSGKPVVKDSTNDKAIIDKAVKEMDDATKDISFAPTPEPAKKK